MVPAEQSAGSGGRVATGVWVTAAIGVLAAVGAVLELVFDLPELVVVATFIAIALLAARAAWTIRGRHKDPILEPRPPKPLVPPTPDKKDLDFADYRSARSSSEPQCANCGGYPRDERARECEVCGAALVGRPLRVRYPVPTWKGD